MTHKKNAVLLYLLAGVMVTPAAGNSTLAADGSVAGAPVVSAGSEPDAAAMLYHLGVSRMNGEGGNQDIVQGRYWIHLAARHGYPLAQYNLGVMYFDGIGGTFSRQCAQWWLTKAVSQDDAEVRQIAGQALQRIEPEMVQLPKVYRPVTEAECDRLPEWQREVRTAPDIPVLPEGDIDTETEVMVVVKEPTVAALAAPAEEHSAVSLMSESAAGETETAEPVQSFSEKAVAELQVSETEISETEAGMVNEVTAEKVTAPVVSETGTENTAEQKTSAENTAGTVRISDIRIQADTVSADGMSVSGTGETAADTRPPTGDPEQSEKTAVTEKIPDAQVSVNEDSNHTGITSADDGMITPAADAEFSRAAGKDSTGEQEAGAESVSSGRAEKGVAAPADVMPVTPETVKPRTVRPAAVPAALNLGGSPATAPGKHYTLQLSGGTTPDELYRTARRYKLRNYVVYETKRHGQRWYVLVAGEYATLTAANQALKELPAELRRSGPWVRSLRQVQNELQ